AAGMGTVERVAVRPVAGTEKRPRGGGGVGVDGAGAGDVVGVGPGAGPLAALRQALADHEGVAGAVPDRQERVLLHEAAVGGAHAAEHDAVAHLQPVVGGTGHAVGGHDVIPAAVAPGPVEIGRAHV